MIPELVRLRGVLLVCCLGFLALGVVFSILGFHALTLRDKVFCYGLGMVCIVGFTVYVESVRVWIDRRLLASVDVSDQVSVQNQWEHTGNNSNGITQYK